MTKESVKEPATDERKNVLEEIEVEIASYNGKIRNSRHKQRLYVLAFVFIALYIIAGITLSITFSNVIFYIDPKYGYSNNIYSFLFFIFIVTGFFGFSFLIFSTTEIISSQTLITSYKAEIDIWKTKRKVATQFAEIMDKPSYFESLVKINVENLESYYGLVKNHTDKSYKTALRVCVFGFILIIIGLAAGFINVENNHIVTYISSASGVITEFISSIFFFLYSKTVRQMKDYHDSLLNVQNALLSFKLIEDTTEEQKKAEIVKEMINTLMGKSIDDKQK